MTEALEPTMKQREQAAWEHYQETLTAMMEMSTNLRLALDACVKARMEWLESHRAMRTSITLANDVR